MGFLTLKDLCTYLKISKETAYRLTSRHDFPKTKLGKLWRFDKDKIDDWIKRQDSSSDDREDADSQAVKVL